MTRRKRKPSQYEPSRIAKIIHQAARNVSPRSEELAHIPTTPTTKKCEDCGKPSNHPCCNKCLNALGL